MWIAKLDTSGKLESAQLGNKIFSLGRDGKWLEQEIGENGALKPATQAKFSKIELDSLGSLSFTEPLKTDDNSQSNRIEVVRQDGARIIKTTLQADGRSKELVQATINTDGELNRFLYDRSGNLSEIYTADGRVLKRTGTQVASVNPQIAERWQEIGTGSFINGPAIVTNQEIWYLVLGLRTRKSFS